MSYLTDKLVEASNGLLKLQPEVTNIKYSMFDDGGVEIEVGEFLYGMVRILKPARILETGTYSGISTMYMAKGLTDNGYGAITTLEYEDYHRRRAMDLWGRIGLKDSINSRLIPSLDYQTDERFDLILLDTEPQIRFQELEKFYPNLNEGGFLFIHDLPRNMTQGNINTDHPNQPSWPFGPIPQEMAKYLTSGMLVKFHLPSPRGLVGFYKPHPADFKI